MFHCRPPTADRACFICLSLKERRGKKIPQKCSALSFFSWSFPCCKVKVSPLEHAALLSVSVSDSCSRFPQVPSVWFPRRLPGEPCISDPMEKNKIRSRALTALRRWDGWGKKKKRATAALLATFHCIIFHSVNAASSCQAPLKFRTRRRRLPRFSPQAFPWNQEWREEKERAEVKDSLSLHWRMLYVSPS